MEVRIKHDATQYSPEELNALSYQATEAALFVLMPHFQDEPFRLNKYDHEMIRIAMKLMIQRKVMRPVIEGGEEGSEEGPG